MSSSKPYVATFNHGAVEEKFFALDDAHASAVAHEIAARRSLCFDAVKKQETKGLTLASNGTNVKV
jgi:hypothetical protein